MNKGAKNYHIKLANEEEVTTSLGYIQLLEQLDPPNILTDKDTYCKEVGAGLTERNIAQMAQLQFFFSARGTVYPHDRLFICHSIN